MLVVTPPGRRVRLRQPYEELMLPGEDALSVMPLHTRPFEAVAWEFVVTRDGPTEVAAETILADDSAHHRIPTWTWTGSRWKGATDLCGRQTIYGPGVVASPSIEFISGCRS